MAPPYPAPLLAVHVSDGVLAWPWQLGGFALAALLLALGGYRVRDREIPRVALLTAAVFVASLIHVKLGPGSAHLLLNGLVGLILGTRAVLAILVGLTLQAVLIGHGGYGTLGINTCVLTLPALIARPLFRMMTGIPEDRVRPVAFVGGFVTGGLAVFLSAVLNCLTLVLGGEEDFRRAAAIILVAHLPLVPVEGVITAFTVDYLNRVRPDLLDESLVIDDHAPVQG